MLLYIIVYYSILEIHNHNKVTGTQNQNAVCHASWPARTTNSQQNSNNTPQDTKNTKNRTQQKYNTTEYYRTQHNTTEILQNRTKILRNTIRQYWKILHNTKNTTEY